jgi:hypothetical protein
MKKMPKNADIFSCSKCDFKCSKYSNYEKHLLTAKHRHRTILNDFMPKNAEYFCECGKRYKARNSLWYHKKKCNAVKNQVTENAIVESTDDIDYKQLFMKALDKLNESEERMCEMMEKVGNTTNNIGNMTNNINNTNNLNINMFLNEQCKNAVNLSDFIEGIVISHDDLENNARLGFVDGMTKIFTDNLKQLTLYERPIHCTDVKRDTLYIKDEDDWKKEHTKDKMNSAIQKISSKSIGELLQWKRTNPDYENIDSEFSNMCLLMQKECIPSDNRDKTYNKVLHKVCSNVTISNDDYRSLN